MPASPSSSAERQRRCRERARRGRIVTAPVAVSPALVEVLVVLGLIDWSGTEDKSLLTSAVEALLDRAALGQFNLSPKEML